MLKMREWYTLLTSRDEHAEGLLQQDSGFCIALANRNMFEAAKEQFQQYESSDLDEVKRAYGDSEQVKVLVLSYNQVIKHFPMVKTRRRYDKHKGIEDIYLITEKANTRTYVSDIGGTQNSLQDFFATYIEFDSDIDSYIKITKDSVHIFAKDQTHRLSFQGFFF